MPWIFVHRTVKDAILSRIDEILFTQSRGQIQSTKYLNRHFLFSRTLARRYSCPESRQADTGLEGEQSGILLAENSQPSNQEASPAGTEGNREQFEILLAEE